MNLQALRDKIAEMVAERGRPEKAYIGDLETIPLVKNITTVETIVNPRRYEGRVVLRWGLEFVEVEVDEIKKAPEPIEKPTPAYRHKKR